MATRFGVDGSDGLSPEGFVTPHWLDTKGYSVSPNKWLNANVSLKTGQVIGIVYPDDTNKRSQITYRVLVNERTVESGGLYELDNCIINDIFGSPADFVEYSLRKNPEAKSMKDLKNAENWLGANVLILYAGGTHETPVILGGLPSPRGSESEERKRRTAEDGLFFNFTFNGVNVNINDNGEVKITKNGPTKDDGTLDTDKSNKDQAGSFITIDKDGSIKISANDKHIIIVDKKEKKVTVDGEEINLNGGSNGAARKNDEIKSTNAEDAKFWTWMTIFKTVLSVPVNEPGLGAPSVFQATLNAALAAAFPDSLTGKITTSSDSVKIGD